MSVMTSVTLLGADAGDRGLKMLPTRSPITPRHRECGREGRGSRAGNLKTWPIALHKANSASNATASRPVIASAACAISDSIVSRITSEAHPSTSSGRTSVTNFIAISAVVPVAFSLPSGPRVPPQSRAHLLGLAGACISFDYSGPQSGPMPFLHVLWTRWMRSWVTYLRTMPLCRSHALLRPHHGVWNCCPLLSGARGGDQAGVRLGRSLVEAREGMYM